MAFLKLNRVSDKSRNNGPGKGGKGHNRAEFSGVYFFFFFLVLNE